jgi:hypothetical protein
VTPVTRFAATVVLVLALWTGAGRAPDPARAQDDAPPATEETGGTAEESPAAGSTPAPVDAGDADAGTAATGTPAPLVASDPGPHGPDQPRVFIIHKELPRLEKGGSYPVLVGTEPVYAPGEQVQVGVYKPGGDDSRIETVEAHVASEHTHPRGMPLRLTETHVSSNTYVGLLEITGTLVTDGPTRDRGFAILSGSGSVAVTQVIQLLSERKDGLPHENLGVLEATSTPGGSGGAFRPPARKWLEIGGSETCTVTFEGRSVSFLAGRTANLLYVAGRYAYADGLMDVGWLSPRDVSDAYWRRCLQVLIVPACFAADVNDYNGTVPDSSMRGLNGVEWWSKFHGTLLGYASAAPPDEAVARVMRTFLTRVARGEAAAAGGDPVARSGLLCRAWMQANLDNLVATAAAIDASGNYSYLATRRTPRLRGCPFTVAASPAGWTTVARQDWEPRSRGIRSGNWIAHWIDHLLQHLARQRSGSPPTAAEFLSRPCVDWVLQASRQPTDNERLRALVRQAMERRHRYEEHVQYDVASRPRTRG